MLVNEIQKEWNELIPSVPDTRMLRRTNETNLQNITLNPRDGSVSKLRIGNKVFESMFELTYVICVRELTQYTHMKQEQVRHIQLDNGDLGWQEKSDV